MGADLDRTVASVRNALQEHGARPPRALFLLATGGDALGDAMAGQREIAWSEIDDVPDPWRSSVLHAGRLGRLDAWVLEDLSGEPTARGSSPWAAAFPVWLASAAGASLCVHASAGTALPGFGAGPGALALVRDHLNLSAANPLAGLGPSALGPLFPDTSHLHHLGLRHAALATGFRLDLDVVEAVAACLPGPALETPAEHQMAARLGAEVGVQGLATPLLAAAHAGLACLAVVAVVDSAASGAADPVRLVERAAELEPDLERFLLALAEDLASAAEALCAESSAGGASS